MPAGEQDEKTDCYHNDIMFGFDINIIGMVDEREFRKRKRDSEF